MYSSTFTAPFLSSLYGMQAFRLLISLVVSAPSRVVAEEYTVRCCLSESWLSASSSSYLSLATNHSSFRSPPLPRSLALFVECHWLAGGITTSVTPPSLFPSLSCAIQQGEESEREERVTHSSVLPFLLVTAEMYFTTLPPWCLWLSFVRHKEASQRERKRGTERPPSPKAHKNIKGNMKNTSLTHSKISPLRGLEVRDVRK